jgi:predicted  nucleic acid-binding Zn-ribbon protein
MDAPDSTTRIDCPECGMIMYLPANFVTIKRNDSRNFFCGAGHQMNFRAQNPDDPKTLKTRIATLENEVRQLKCDNARLLHKMDQAGVS